VCAHREVVGHFECLCGRDGRGLELDDDRNDEAIDAERLTEDNTGVRREREREREREHPQTITQRNGGARAVCVPDHVLGADAGRPDGRAREAGAGERNAPGVRGGGGEKKRKE